MSPFLIIFIFKYYFMIARWLIFIQDFGMQEDLDTFDIREKRLWKNRLNY